MNPRYKTLLMLLSAILLLLAGCRQERYAYVSDAPRNEVTTIGNLDQQKLVAGDKIYIYVYSQNLESVVPFNQETNMNVSENRSSASRNGIPGYTVSTSGEIIFPSLGRLHVAGMTLQEMERDIETRLVEGLFVKDPIVSASLMNFRVTVIGEVKKPQMVVGNGNRMTILEAIARCGDITMTGIRSMVTVIRTVEGGHTVDTVDLTSRSLFDSPYYYLQSGDIVYVEPTKKRKREAYRNEDWPMYLTTGVSALRIAYTIYYQYVVRRVQDRL